MSNYKKQKGGLSTPLISQDDKDVELQAQNQSARARRRSLSNAGLVRRNTDVAELE